MGFDAKAFATAFLEGQAVDIKARLQEAREEGKRKAEIARTAGMSQWKKRKGVANAYKLYVDYLDNAGMSQENLRYLIQSPKSLVEAYKGIKNFSDTHRGEKLDEETINSIVDLSSTFVDEKGPDGKPLYSLDQLIKRMAGLYKENHNTTSTDPMSKYENLLASALSLNADERYNIKMKSQMVGDNFNMLDLYDMGAAGDFVPESIAPVDVNIGLIPTALSERDLVSQADDFNAMLQTLMKEDLDAARGEDDKINTMQWDAKKDELFTLLSSPNPSRYTLQQVAQEKGSGNISYGAEALRRLKEQGSFYNQIYNNPYLPMTAEQRQTAKDTIETQEKLSSDKVTTTTIPKNFDTQDDLVDAILNKNLKVGDKFTFKGSDNVQTVVQENIDKAEQINTERKEAKSKQKIDKEKEKTPLESALTIDLGTEQNARAAVSSVANDIARTTGFLGAAFKTIREREEAEELRSRMFFEGQIRKELLNALNSDERIDEFKNDPKAFLDKYVKDNY